MNDDVPRTAWHLISAQKTGPVIIFIIIIEAVGRWQQQLQAGKECLQTDSWKGD